MGKFRGVENLPLSFHLSIKKATIQLKIPVVDGCCSALSMAKEKILVAMVCGAKLEKALRGVQNGRCRGYLTLILSLCTPHSAPP